MACCSDDPRRRTCSWQQQLHRPTRTWCRGMELWWLTAQRKVLDEAATVRKRPRATVDQR
jgi:hypothetical protein